MSKVQKRKKKETGEMQRQTVACVCVLYHQSVVHDREQAAFCLLVTVVTLPHAVCVRVCVFCS